MSPGEWFAFNFDDWFAVIGECLNFVQFGVYEFSDDSICVSDVVRSCGFARFRVCVRGCHCNHCTVCYTAMTYFCLLHAVLFNIPGLNTGIGYFVFVCV